MEKANYKIARFLSYALHPLLMPSYGMALLFLYNSFLSFTLSPFLKIAAFSLVFIGTFIIPALASYILLNKGLIKSLEMETKEERRLPFIVTAFSFMATYYFLSHLQIPRIYSLLVLGSTFMVVLSVIINFRWKISIHLIGIGGLTGALVGISHHIIANLEIPIIICLILSGFLATSRIILKSHIPAQVYAGFLLGFICEWALFSL